VLPYDYAVYGKAIQGYVTAAANKAKSANLQDDFTPLTAAAVRFTVAGTAVRERQVAETGDVAALNHGLRAAEEALLNPAGLPHRDWYKHTIYAPGEFTGYAAVVIPGVNEAIEAKDAARAQTQIDALTSALNRAAEVLEQAAK
jgi:N-acetylated-alpha-linked acidic dipeptidase